MDQPGPSGSGEPNAKKRKECSLIENYQNTAGDDAIAIVAGEEQTGDIFKMDIDCGEEVFDYLPVKDLISVGKTCKRLQQVAGHCFQQNYSLERVYISRGGIYINISGKKHHVQHFAPFIQTISIDDEYGLQYFVRAQSNFRRLKQIKLNSPKSSNMDCLKKISMGKLEELYIYKSELSNDIHEIIDQCAKLERLDIFGCKSTSDWVNRKYPTLKHFRFYPEGDNFSEGIPAFLELNPNIRRFGTNAKFFWKYRDIMMTADIKLDDLHISGIYDESVFKSICDLLDELHARGFYKKLKLLIGKNTDQEDIDRLVSLNGLNKLGLYAWSNIRSLTFSALNNLEELLAFSSNQIADIDKLPSALINLKRIRFLYTSFDSIIPFIRRSVEMQQITVDSLRAGVHFNKDTGIIDLPALNRERALLTPEQLAGVQKVTLYVSEQIYLATKWAFGETDFEYVQLKRYF